MAGYREESNAIVATQAELLRYKSNSERKKGSGWKAPRPPSSPSVDALGDPQETPVGAERSLGSAAAAPGPEEGEELEGWANDRAGGSLHETDDIPASAPAVDTAKEEEHAPAAVDAKAEQEPVAAAAAAAAPEETAASANAVVPEPEAAAAAEYTAAVADQHTAPASRMTCLEQGIEYRPLKPPALILPSAEVEQPLTPASPAAHPGAGLFATDTEPGPSNAVNAPSPTAFEMGASSAGPRSLTMESPRSVAAVIATERSAVAQERTTVGIQPPVRRTLRPVELRGSTPRSAARRTLAGTPSTPNIDAMRAARVVLADEWRTKTFGAPGAQLAEALPRLHSAQKQPLLGASGVRLSAPNTSGWHGGCGDWRVSSGPDIGMPAFDTGRRSPVGELVEPKHLPVVAALWPKPPPKSRVQATKARKQQANAAVYAEGSGGSLFSEGSRGAVASVVQSARGPLASPDLLEHVTGRSVRAPPR